MINVLVPSGPPTALSHRDLTSNSVVLQWELPDEQERNGEIEEYEVHVADLSTNESFAFYTSNQSLLLSDLEPFRYYRYSVAAATVIGYGPRSPHLTLRTNEDGKYT